MIHRIHLLLALALTAAGFALGAAVLPHLPAQVPTHWNLRGQPDAYGPAWEDAFLIPSIALVLMAFLILVPNLPRLRATFSSFARTYGRICVTLAAVLLAIHTIVLLSAAGRSVPVAQSLASLMSLLIAVLGNWMGKLRRNALVGIRTPWTLASDEVWAKTHRTGGKLMFITGLLLIPITFFAPPMPGALILLSALVALAVWAMVYSRQLYNNP